MAIFLSLSGNARNLILASDDLDTKAKSLWFFRLSVLIPAALAVFLLLGNTIEISTLLIIGLVGRKSMEWLAELQLAQEEYSGNYRFASKYIVVNSIGYLSVVATVVIPSLADYFFACIFIWAVLPALHLTDYARYIWNLRNSQLNFVALMPHMGSSTIIGISTYVFRTLIVIMVGKSFAGSMFTAYALGGVLSSLYVYAIGPSLMLRAQGDNIRPLYYFSIFCMLLGLLTIVSVWMWHLHLSEPVFVYSIGFSLVGGGVMLLAQRHRLKILQCYKRDVFVPDAISNILLICSIPFAFYLFGEISLALFFLWSALLHLVFYALLVKRVKYTSLGHC